MLLILGAPAAAQPSYEAAWRNARAAVDRGEYAVALQMLDDALARAGNSDAEAVWALRIQRATILILMNRNDDAKAILGKPFPAKLARTATAARRHIARTRFDWYADQATSRDAEIAAAVQIARKHVPAILPEILTSIDPKEALVLARKAGDKLMAAKAEAAVALHHAANERYAEALEIGEPLRPRLAQLGLTTLYAKHTGNLGWIYYELGDYDRATELLEFAVSETGRMGIVTEQWIWFTTLSNVYIARGDWAGALQLAQRIIAATESTQHRSRGHAFTNLARAYLETGRIAEARAAVVQSLARENEIEADYVTKVVEARIDIASGHHDVALKTLQQVIAATEEASTKLAAQGQLVRVYAVTKQHQLAEKTFNAAVAQIRAARKTLTPETRIAFFNTVAELFDSYVDFLVSTSRTEEALRVTEISRAQTLADTLDVATPQRLDAKQLARQRNATILCYWLGRHRSYVWTVTPNAIRITTLKSGGEIKAAVARYAAQLVTNAGALERSGARGQALFDVLVAKAAAGLPPNARVIVVPDGALHTLNFETLVTPAKRYWIEDVVLANASSLQLLARGATAHTQTPRMLLIGNPPQADPAFPVLKQAADEIQRIEKRFPGRATVLSGPRATPAAYKAAGPQNYDFVHFVAHGVAVRNPPLDSAVILGPDANRDYRLSAREISAQPLDARLVTISSCHGAGSTTYAGEGLIGLAWAFLYAGAQQVVAALWAVNDTAAPKLMDQLYAGIRAGNDPEVALREAKLGLLRSKTSHQHAKYWAPFVIYQ
ncbi:MAG TPA: CHAT domain-containing tetratricopeptide repeat protein [Thermoanaerobaculia bacterium]|nr:CHAT domain-containing tetratricopeptide repeat protein [Thermoanaerobaculia bacterium]